MALQAPRRPRRPQAPVATAAHSTRGSPLERRPARAPSPGRRRAAGDTYDVVLSSGFLAFANHSGFLQAVEEVRGGRLSLASRGARRLLGGRGPAAVSSSPGRAALARVRNRSPIKPAGSPGSKPRARARVTRTAPRPCPLTARSPPARPRPAHRRRRPAGRHPRVRSDGHQRGRAGGQPLRGGLHAPGGARPRGLAPLRGRARDAGDALSALTGPRARPARVSEGTRKGPRSPQAARGPSEHPGPHAPRQAGGKRGRRRSCSRPFAPPRAAPHAARPLTLPPPPQLPFTPNPSTPQVAQHLRACPPIQLLRPCWEPWRGGLLSMDAVIERLAQLLPPTFEELERDFAVGVVTADGEHVLIDSGPLPEAVVASAAIPFVFSAVDVPGALPYRLPAGGGRRAVPRARRGGAPLRRAARAAAKHEPSAWACAAAWNTQADPALNPLACPAPRPFPTPQASTLA